MRFDIIRSSKSYINSDEHYIVVFEGVVYLRVVGSEGDYIVMTATAGEDFNGVVAYGNLVELNEAALRASKAFGLIPAVKRDYHGREYVEVCRCEYLSDAYRAAEQVFSLLKKHSPERTKKEMVEVYSELSVDDSGGDVYLSDGLWLSSDGSVADRSR